MCSSAPLCLPGAGRGAGNAGTGSWVFLPRPPKLPALRAMWRTCGGSFQPPKGAPPLVPLKWLGCSARHLVLLWPLRGSPGPGHLSTASALLRRRCSSCPFSLPEWWCIYLFVWGFSEAGRPAAFQPHHGGADDDHRVSRPVAPTPGAAATRALTCHLPEL